MGQLEPHLPRREKVLDEEPLPQRLGVEQGQFVGMRGMTDLHASLDTAARTPHRAHDWRRSHDGQANSWRHRPRKSSGRRQAGNHPAMTEGRLPPTGRTVHRLDPDGTVRDWLVSPVRTRPCEDLDQVFAADADVWEGRWVLTNGPDVA